jgi:hypothetical protein
MNMKAFADGDQVCITLNDFVNLQESPAVFVPLDSPIGRAFLAPGVPGPTAWDLMRIKKQLEAHQEEAQRHEV